MKKKITKYLVIFLCYGVNFILPILFFKEISYILSPAVLTSFFFVLALLIYCQYVVEYGLQISLLKKLSNNKLDLSYDISSILELKILLFITCSFFLLIILTYSNDIIFSILIIVLLGNVFSCQFLYQVVDRLHFFYIINTISKIIFIPLIYIDSNYIYLLICYSLFNVFPNLISFTMFLYNQRIKLVWVPIETIFILAKEKFGYFASNISITLYTNFYQVLLGIISPSYLAAYALSDKIIRGVIAGNYVFIQIIQVQFLNDESKFLDKIEKILVILFFLGLVESCVIFFGASFFEVYFFPKIPMLSDFLKLMSFLVIIILISNFFAMVYLPCTGNTHFLSKVFITVSIFSVISAPLLIYYYAGYGAISAAILSEMLVLTFCYVFYRKIRYANNIKY
uniref:O-antigen flippase n=1 Tax=Salmonella enterica TaxID=28901 RepID=U3GLR1_SALER|nr:O-antigen flippase [Salmonella enterica]